MTKRTATKFYIFIIALLTISIILIIPPFYISNNLMPQNVYIDKLDLSGLSKEEAVNALNQSTQEMLDNTYITITIGEQSEKYSFNELGISFNIDDAIDKVIQLKKQNSLLGHIISKIRLLDNPIYIQSELIIDGYILESYVKQLKSKYDIDVEEHEIEFFPDNYSYLNSAQDSSDMFIIKEGKNGQCIDFDTAKSLLLEAINIRLDSTIELKLNVIEPKYSLDEIQNFTSLVCHCSSYLGTNKHNSDRNFNIQKALDFFNGLVIDSGETVSFFDIIGEPSGENGWISPNNPLLIQNKDATEFYGGVAQVATTLYNAMFLAGAEIIEHHSYPYPAYYTDFGYGMDAYVDYGTCDLVFKNTSNYPMYIKAYTYNDLSRGYPIYLDIDIYTMPLDNNTYIKAESVIESKLSAPTTKYVDVNKDNYPYLKWEFYDTVGKYHAIYQNGIGGAVVRIYKVWYRNGQESSSGVWEGGIEINREEYDYVVYPAKQEIIFVSD